MTAGALDDGTVALPNSFTIGGEPWHDAAAVARGAGDDKGD